MANLSTYARGTLTSNSALSLGAALVSAAFTLATLPYIVGRLGLPAYGLFALLSLTTSALGALDLGFGWTTSRFLAEAIERNDESRAQNLARISLLFYIILGLVGGAALILFAGPLIGNVFNVHGNLRHLGIEAASVFGLAFPFGMLQTFGAAVLRGARRFDLSSYLQVIAGPASSLAMVVVLAFDGGLLGVSFVVLITQFLIGVVGLILARRSLPTVLVLGPVNLRSASPLIGFTLTISAANFGMQLLYLPNRLAVGILLSPAAVGLFTVPLGLAQRLLLVPVALGGAALPSLTASAARNDYVEFRQSLWRLMASTVVLLTPAFILAELWAPTLLRIWFSDDFSSGAAWVLRLTLVATLLNSLAGILAVASDSAGVPHISAIAVLIAGIINLPLAFVLTGQYGITGSAAALTVSYGINAVAILVLWIRAGFPVPLPRTPYRLGLRATGVAMAVALWIGGLILLQPAIRSRPLLVMMAGLALTIAYGFIVVVTVGWPRAACWFRGR
jgi:O-antigen/teichoic acid export membrane protein